MRVTLRGGEQSCLFSQLSVFIVDYQVVYVGIVLEYLCRTGTNHYGYLRLRVIRAQDIKHRQAQDYVPKITQRKKQNFLNHIQSALFGLLLLL